MKIVIKSKMEKPKIAEIYSQFFVNTEIILLCFQEFFSLDYFSII